MDKRTGAFERVRWWRCERAAPGLGDSGVQRNAGVRAVRVLRGGYGGAEWTGTCNVTAL